VVSTRKHCGFVAVRQHVRFFVRESVAASFEVFVCASINQCSQFFVEPFEGDGFESVRRYICEPAAALAAPALNQLLRAGIIYDPQQAGEYVKSTLLALLPEH
jgi:hypothetical protein